MRAIGTLLRMALPAAILLGAAPALADVKSGVDAWERGDYKAAVAEWRPLAIDGDPDAQFNIGQAYKLGRGVPVDLGQAELWYRRAADQGHLQAEDNLGLVLFTANRREEAMTYIMRASDRGEPRAQYVLGTAHFNGDLAERDWARAYALTKRASDAGLQIASARLAQLDRLIPLEDRQRGLAMLPDMERNEQRTRLAAATAAMPAASKPAPSPVKPTRLPPSEPGVRYTPPPVIASGPVPRPPAFEPPAARVPDAPAMRPVVIPRPIETTELPPSEPGTSYAPPPEAEDLPPAAAPAPVAAPVPVRVAAAPPSAAPKPTPAAKKAGWRAQLGAFGEEGRARALWLSLEKKYPAVAAAQPYLVKAGNITRLQAGEFASRSEADAFCAKVKPGGQACVVVGK
jgi:hypothetical protein